MDWEPLAAAARAARENAYAPYSRYRVGAALLTAGGRVVAGCNVENRLPALAVCAERVAVVRGVAGGVVGPDAPPRALAVATGSSPPAAPCGLCLETLAELVEDLPILLVNDTGEREETRLGRLLTRRFSLPDERTSGPSRGSG